ncbi:GNAT family N-acetyltransferase [Rodentibacter caecimuris]|uniref:GNAT family N-acetyltransferase n=1 Tax=Rodentibacter caecimuris TaxID=1796644 RepID=A0ABX3KZ65_9PAST|nr:GNAT family N-acetyltransferase [Rodentibacter heylii]
MNIEHNKTEQGGEFFILDAQKNKIAKLTYFYENPQRINANHTYVSEVLRGQGIADKLYQTLIEFIEHNQLSLHPTCSYIAQKWERNQAK